MREKLYQQIARTIQNEIETHPDLVRIDTETKLAERFQVGVSTIKRALNELVVQGLIQRVPGKGTFVSERHADDASTRLTASESESHGVVGVVIPGIGDPFATRMLGGILTGLHEAGQLALVGFSDDQQDRESNALRKMRKHVDGLIVFPAEGEMYNDELLRLKVDRFPFVVLDRGLPGIDVPCVASNHSEITRRATRFLIDRGHQEVVFVAASSLHPISTQSITLRIEGFREAVEATGKSAEPLIWTRQLFRDAATDQLSGLLADRLVKQRVTAVIGNSIADTQLVVEAVHAVGLNIPADLCVVGFDYGLAAGAAPGIYWIDQHEHRLGWQAAKMLMAALADKPIGEGAEIAADLRLVGSTTDSLVLV